MSSGRKWAYRIEHILEAVAKIRRYTAGMSEAEFVRNDLVADAVIRNFQVIGEAARQVPPDAVALHVDIPWKQMAGMRNIIVHGYDVVRLDIVWRTVQEDLPALIDPLNAALKVARAAEDDGGTTQDA